MSSRCHKAPAPFKGQSYRLGACEEIKRTAHDQRQSEETDSFGNEDHSRALLVAAHQPIPEEARHLPPFLGKNPRKYCTTRTRRWSSATTGFWCGMKTKRTRWSRDRYMYSSFIHHHVEGHFGALFSSVPALVWLHRRASNRKCSCTVLVLTDIHYHSDPRTSFFLTIRDVFAQALPVEEDDDSGTEAFDPSQVFA